MKKTAPNGRMPPCRLRLRLMVKAEREDAADEHREWRAHVPRLRRYLPGEVEEAS